MLLDADDTGLGVANKGQSCIAHAFVTLQHRISKEGFTNLSIFFMGSIAKC